MQGVAVGGNVCPNGEIVFSPSSRARMKAGCECTPYLNGLGRVPRVPGWENVLATVVASNVQARALSWFITPHRLWSSFYWNSCLMTNGRRKGKGCRAVLSSIRVGKSLISVNTIMNIYRRKSYCVANSLDAVAMKSG